MRSFDFVEVEGRVEVSGLCLGDAVADSPESVLTASTERERALAVLSATSNTFAPSRALEESGILPRMEIFDRHEPMTLV